MSQPPRPQSGMPGGGPRARLIPLLATAFLLLMGVAWLMSTPPGSAFDERAHYIKAIGVGRGELYGQAPAVKRQDLDALFKLGSRDEGALKQLADAVASPQVRWQARTRREFHVPPALIDPGFGCTAESPEVTGACLEKARPPNRQRLWSSYVGSYQPYLYVPAGLAIRLADDPGTALRLGRAATLALAVLLLIGAVWLLWTPRAPGLSLLGLAVAVTPMVMYVASVLSPSGPEIAGAICFSAALLRLGRAEPQPRWLWGTRRQRGRPRGLARARPCVRGRAARGRRAADRPRHPDACDAVGRTAGRRCGGCGLGRNSGQRDMGVLLPAAAVPWSHRGDRRDRSIDLPPTGGGRAGDRGVRQARRAHAHLGDRRCGPSCSSRSSRRLS